MTTRLLKCTPSPSNALSGIVQLYVGGVLDQTYPPVTILMREWVEFQSIYEGLYGDPQVLTDSDIKVLETKFDDPNTLARLCSYLADFPLILKAESDIPDYEAELTDAQLERQAFVDLEIKDLIVRLNPTATNPTADPIPTALIAYIAEAIRAYYVEDLKVCDDQAFYPYLEEITYD